MRFFKKKQKPSRSQVHKEQMEGYFNKMVEISESNMKAYALLKAYEELLEEVYSDGFRDGESISKEVDKLMKDE